MSYDPPNHLLATKRRKSYASGGSDSGKPCPTCYAQMTPSGSSSWECAKHGTPTKP
jgi:hypothetical protein